MSISEPTDKQREMAHLGMISRRGIQLKAFLSLVAFFLLLMKGAIDACEKVNRDTAIQIFSASQILVYVVTFAFLCFNAQIEWQSYLDKRDFAFGERVPRSFRGHLLEAWAGTWTSLVALVFAAVLIFELNTLMSMTSEAFKQLGLRDC